jgi:hypothetical protein
MSSFASWAVLGNTICMVDWIWKNMDIQLQGQQLLKSSEVANHSVLE